MSLSNYIIPVVNVPQTFVINLANIDYTLTVKYNDQAANLDPGDSGWILDIADASQNPIAAGIPFICGADLLSGLEYLGIDGSLIVYTNGNPNEVPTQDNLGTDCNLYFQTSVANNGG